MARKILQIVPATSDWHARFRNEDGSFDLSRIALFALVDDGDGDGPFITCISGTDDNYFDDGDDRCANFAGCVSTV